jgi:spermidine/putrescine transport system permease protein
LNRTGRFGLFGIYGVFFVLLLYGPVLLLPPFSFNDNIYITFPFKGFTTRWYQEMASSTPLIAALRNSLTVGIPVAIISTVLGLLAARALTRYRLPGRGPVTALIMIPLVIPFIILGIALLSTLRHVFNADLSLWTIGGGHVLICIPFSVLVLMSRLEGFDKSLEEASLDLGENAWGTFWRVTFPLTLPGIVASLLLAFTESLDEFLIAFFLSGSDATMPIFIWSQLRFPQKLPDVLALGSCILVFSFVLVVVAEMVRRRGVQLDKQTAF